MSQVTTNNKSQVREFEIDELSKAPTSLNERQLQMLLAPTPERFKKIRPAKGGGVWEYVSGTYVKKALNFISGWDWDFEILDEKILIEARQVIVKGKLTIRIGELGNKQTIVKMQYGRKDIIFRKGTEIPLDIGNDLKASCTDALKKCAAEFGIASDVYGKDEFVPVNVKNGSVSSVDREKTKKRVITHIVKSTNLDDLSMVEDLVGNFDLDDVYEIKKEMLTSKSN